MGSIVKTSHLVLGPGIYRIVNTVSGARASISDETRKRMSEGQRGRRWSPEQRAKVLAALIGRPVSVETRAKRAEARRNDSPEIRAKRAAAIRAAYARKREAAAAKDSA